MLRRFTDYLVSFLPACQPLMTRQAYRFEVVSAATVPIAVSMVEGGVAGTLAKKLFGVDGLQYALIMAAPFMANMTSYGWAVLARGKPKIVFMTTLQLALLVCVAAVALLPANATGGGWGLVALVMLSRSLLSGAVTIRSAVWRLNYPRAVRAQVTAKMVVIMSLAVVVGPLIAYAFLDRNPAAYRYVYPAAAAIGLIGVASFRRVRVRREKQLLASELEQARPQKHGDPMPGAAIYEYEIDAPPRDTFWTVLRRDHAYRSYQTWQFVLGLSNIAAETALIYFIADHTKGRPFEYSLTVALSVSVPMLIALVVLPFWAKYLDRVHIAEFRTRHTILFVGAQLLNLAAVWLLLHGWIDRTIPADVRGDTSRHWPPLLFAWWLAVGYGPMLVARFAQGVARGGGMLAWNLGHHDFADRRLVSLYMGIHVTLTGLRGAVAPFLGTLLFVGVHRWGLRFNGLGPWFFGLTALGSLLAWLGYVRLHRTMKANGQLGGAED